MTLRLIVDAIALATVCFFAVFILNRLVIHDSPKALVLGLVFVAAGAGVGFLEAIWPLLCEAFPTLFVPARATIAVSVLLVGVAITAWQIGARHVLDQVEIWKRRVAWDGEERRCG